MLEQKKKPQKTVRITFRAEPELETFLKEKKNKSKFIRDAILYVQHENKIDNEILKQLLPLLIDSLNTVSLKTTAQEERLMQLLEETK